MSLCCPTAGQFANLHPEEQHRGSAAVIPPPDSSSLWHQHASEVAALDWISDHSICKYRKLFLERITLYKRKNFASKSFLQMFKVVDALPKVSNVLWPRQKDDWCLHLPAFSSDAGAFSPSSIPSLSNRSIIIHCMCNDPTSRTSTSFTIHF